MYLRCTHIHVCTLQYTYIYTTVLAFSISENAKKVLRRTPPPCSNLPTKSFPFSEKVFMPPSRHGKVASLIFRPGYGQYGHIYTYIHCNTPIHTVYAYTLYTYTRIYTAIYLYTLYTYIPIYTIYFYTL